MDTRADHSTDLLSPVETRTPGCFLYLVTRVGEMAPCKVGITRTPANRLKTLQTGSPYPLMIREQFLFSSIAEAFVIEQTALATFVSRRCTGEWLDVDWTELSRAVPKLATQALPLLNAVMPDVSDIIILRRELPGKIAPDQVYGDAFGIGLRQNLLRLALPIWRTFCKAENWPEVIRDSDERDRRRQERSRDMDRLGK